MKQSLKEFCLLHGREDFLQQWHPTKNESVTPDTIGPGSSKYIWWLCEKGHEWQAQPNNRIGKHSNCPYCAGKRALPGSNDLATTHPDLAAQWHPTKNAPLTPDTISHGSTKEIWWLCEKGHEWQAQPKTRTKFSSGCPYCSGRRALPGSNDLATTHPDLVAQWHPTKNAPLTPDTISYGSAKQIWWLCEKGHEWQAILYNRTASHTVCPYCSGRRVLSGFNDLATTHPDLAAQWHPTKNAPLTPDTISHGSTKEIWWLCEKGHEWQATPNLRTQKSSRCPYCFNRKVIPGHNDLATTHPDIAVQWHPTLNAPLDPTMVSAGSNKLIWWICEKGHEWLAQPNHRTRNSSRCPYCSGRRALSGSNNLATTHPDIAAQWHPTKNAPLDPTMVSAGSNKRVWWFCEKGHEWQTIINGRTQYSSRCPYCSGRKVSPGLNDFATSHPDLAAQWHPTKNAPLDPTMVSAFSNKLVWWVCEKGHEWQAMLNNRTSKHTGCPYCAGRKVIPGHNDLATRHPDIAAQWHPTKNAPLDPTLVSAGSNKCVWWLCENGHEWLALINNRTQHSSRCPFCAQKDSHNK